MTALGLGSIVGFQLVWLACAFGAASGHSAPGLAAAAVVVSAHLAAGGGSSGRVWTFVAAGAIGLGAESLLAASGLVVYAAPWPRPDLAPAWIVGLWVAFATTLPILHRLLGPGRWLTASVLGAMLGPLSYLAAARVGALAVANTAISSLLAIAAIWALALPILLAIQAHVDPAGERRHQ